MIESLLLASVGAGVASGLCGFLLGRRAKRPMPAPRPPSMPVSALSDRRRLEAARLEAEQTLLTMRSRFRRAMALPPEARDGGLGRLGIARPSAALLDRVASRLRGLTLVDDVVIADSEGLLRSRAAGSPRSALELATLGAALGRIQAFADTRRVSATTSGAQFVSARRLPQWASDTWLFAKTTHAPTAELALDSAIAFAELCGAEETVAPDMPTAFSSAAQSVRPFGAEEGSRSGKLAAELGSLLRQTSAHTIALANEGELLFGASAQPTRPDSLASEVTALEALRVDLRRRLRTDDVMRIDLMTASGARWLYAPLEAGGRVAMVMVSDGTEVEPLVVDRLVGRARRAISTAAHTPTRMNQTAAQV